MRGCPSGMLALRINFSLYRVRSRTCLFTTIAHDTQGILTAVMCCAGTFDVFVVTFPSCKLRNYFRITLVRFMAASSRYTMLKIGNTPGKVCPCERLDSVWMADERTQFGSELSVGLFSSTQPNPTHQITDPTQPNPLPGELMDP